MREILRELNTTPGVHGSAVVMSDGVIVAAELASGTDGEPFAALASSLLANVAKSVPKLELGNLRRVLVTASRGAFSLTDLGGAYLVAELERDIEPSVVDLEIESAASRLRRSMRPKSEIRVAAALPSAAPESVNADAPR